MKNINLSAWALTHPQMVLFLLLLMSIAGIVSYQNLGRKEDPDFAIKAMVVQAFWPGAGAEEVAEQVTDKLEKKLQQIPEIDFTSSYSKPGETLITITLREDVPSTRTPAVWTAVRNRLTDIQTTLPQGVQGPFFNDQFGDTFGNVYALTGDGLSYPELRDLAKAARNEFLRVPGVSRVDLVGEQAQRIYVEASTDKLASLGLDPAQFANALQSTNVIAPAGVIETNAERIRLKVSGEFDSVENIRELGVSIGNRILRLGDVAEVRRGLIDPPTFKMRFQGKPAIGLAISTRPGVDITQFGHVLNETAQRVLKSAPLGLEIHAVSDQPRIVTASIKEFTTSLLEAVIIVLAVSFVSLGLRTGLVVALSIPLVLAITFFCMYLLGIELQRISLGALIIALGLLVDDAIIAVEMMALKLEQGWDRFRAATHAYSVTAFPMLTGTLITAAGFMPVGFSKSSAGEYCFSLFQVVAIALIVSWLVAVIFTPFIGHRLLTEHKNAHEDEEAVYQSPLYVRVRRLVDFCVRQRAAVLLATLLAFCGSVALFVTAVPMEFFPNSQRPELMVHLWLPQGATFAATEQEVATFEKHLQNDPDIISATSFVGGGAPRYYLPLDVQMPHLNLAEIMVMTRDEAARERVVARLEALFEKDFPSVRGRVNRLANGPGGGYPVQFRVSGPDSAKVREIADQVAERMRAHPNVRNTNKDWGERLKSVAVQVDQDKVRRLGLSSRDIKAALHMALTGTSITQYLEGDKSLDVVGRLVAADRRDLNNIKDTKIYLRDGKHVPLTQVAHFSIESEESLLWRRNSLPTITVRSDVFGAKSLDVTTALQPRIDELSAKLPLGYLIETGGQAESSGKSQASIVAVIPATSVVVMVLLMLQLQNIGHMALVLITAPLGLIGVATIMAIFRIPFGFVAMLGVFALSGMIIRNSVILVVQIEQERKEGAPLWTAIVDSTVRRFRPIVLTALAAILAMIPLTRSVFWGPMAWAIMGGLMVATLLTLLVLPAMFAAWHRAKPVAAA
ncbi:MAG TPA: efflux RND transporter permease subunit [Rhodocyclaceae bacterium]|nr:efflux RND transporter permease subunit [Rhodocyclaceae bacterium]